MQRRVQSSYCDRQPVHYRKYCFEIFLLHWQKFIQRLLTFLGSFRNYHLLHYRNASLGKKHMFCPAKTNTFSAKFQGFNRIGRSIGVGTNFKCAYLVGPAHELCIFCRKFRLYRSYFTGYNFTGRTVQRNNFAFSDGQLAYLKTFLGSVYTNRLGTADTAFAHATGYYCRVRGHTAARGKNTYGRMHAFYIIRVGLFTY